MDIWDKYIAEEESEQVNTNLYGYTDEYGYGGDGGGGDGDDEFGGGDKDYSDDEFGAFGEQTYDEPEFGYNYSQFQQVSYGDPEMGTTIGGKFSKLDKIVQQQTVSKEKLYLSKFKAELSNYFSYDAINEYSTLIQKVPRYWLKNITALSGALFYIHNLRKSYPIAKPTVKSLEEFSEKTHIRKEDLYRYYRLLINYI